MEKMLVTSIFNSTKHKVLRVSFCDHSASVRHLSVCHPVTFPCLYSSIYKYLPISTKLGQNTNNDKILDEYDYGFNRTRTSGVICPWIRKIAIFQFVYALASTNINQSVPNPVKIYMTIRSQMCSIMGLIKLECLELFALEWEKLLHLTLFTL